MKWLKILLIVTAILALWLVGLVFYLAWPRYQGLIPTATPINVNQPPGLQHYVKPSEPVPQRIPMNIP